MVAFEEQVRRGLLSQSNLSVPWDFSFRIKDIIEGDGSCSQGGISGTKRCFRSPKELGNKKPKKLGAALLILIFVKYFFVSKTK